jgi:hypothetical protein
MSLLKGNYKLDDEHNPTSDEQRPAEKLLEQEYYKAAMNKLGGSIAFIMKDKTFLWKGDNNTQEEKAEAKVDAAAKKT